MNMGISQTQKRVYTAVAIVVFATLPIFSFGKSHTIYVDGDVKKSEKQTGSYDHPYRTIADALKHADSGDEVRVKNGTYKEAVTIPSGVKLTSDSDDRNKVTIKSGSNDKPVVKMKNRSKVSAVTIKGGRHGIEVSSDAKAHIYNVTIKDADRDGIHIESAKVDSSKKVLIDTVYIAKNGKSGIYSEKRLLTVINSDIDSNGLDGIDVAAGSKVWIEDVRSRWNGGSGLKATVDGSSVWAKSSSFRYNGHEGIEVSSYGGGGTVGVKKGNIVGNRNYGIAQISRNGVAFRGLEIGDGVNVNKMFDNVRGNVSNVLRVW